jgi:hypothetical protein
VVIIQQKNIGQSKHPLFIGILWTWYGSSSTPPYI